MTWDLFMQGVKNNLLPEFGGNRETVVQQVTTWLGGAAKALGVSQSTVSNWLARTLKEEKERKRDKAFAMWQACHTQEEISESAGIPVGTVPEWEKEFLEKLEDDNSRNWHDFDSPLYNVWKQQDKTAGVNYLATVKSGGWKTCCISIPTPPISLSIPLPAQASPGEFSRWNPSYCENMAHTAELPGENWGLRG